MKESVGQKIYEVKINKIINAKSDLYKNGVSISEYKIIGISKYKICINNDHFSTFNYTSEKGERKDKWGDYLDTANINIKTKEDYFGSGIFSTMYCSKKPTKATLNKIVKEISVKIDKEYGFLFSNFKMELSSFVDNYKIEL